jgi:hypothetical protein
MEIARKVLFLVEELQAVHARTEMQSTRVEEHWLPPETGWVKANVDGSFSAESGTGGSGLVMRDHHGSFLAGACHFMSTTADPERAELQACRSAIVLAKELGIDKICLESDCLSAISKLKNAVKDRSIHGPVVEEIRILLFLSRLRNSLWLSRNLNH